MFHKFYPASKIPVINTHTHVYFHIICNIHVMVSNHFQISLLHMSVHTLYKLKVIDLEYCPIGICTLHGPQLYINVPKLIQHQVHYKYLRVATHDPLRPTSPNHSSKTLRSRPSDSLSDSTTLGS